MSGVQGQTSQVNLTWVGGNKVVVRSSEKDHSVRYYVVAGLEVYDDVILGNKTRVIGATGVWQDEKLDYLTNEGAVVIIETGHGYEYCGVARSGARTGVIINRMPVELENVDVTWCPVKSEVQFIMEDLMMRGLSVASPIMNPWVGIVPYVLYTLRRFGYGTNLGVLYG
ncbi:MAG: hypothetical protein RQ842_05710 [Vulcanisaeta sp.]|nr:hypothetical protein [Vulcanisaeta sp.]